MSLMGAILGEPSDFQAVKCCACSVAFAMTRDLYRQRLNDKNHFWCPNGHEQHFTGKSADAKEVERLKRELEAQKREAERARQAREWAETSARGARIQAGKAKAATRRPERRVNCGVCPHCQRTFKQLAAHMKSKHPEV